MHSSAWSTHAWKTTPKRPLDENRMHTAKPGEALKNLRKRNRWTLTDVSKKTGIPPSTLSRIENDQISPTYDLLLRLSNGLSLDLTQLLSLEEGSNSKE